MECLTNVITSQLPQDFRCIHQMNKHSEKSLNRNVMEYVTWKNNLKKLKKIKRGT
jgi:hypothetical protein